LIALNLVTSMKSNHNATQLTIKRFNVFGMQLRTSARKDYAKMPNINLKGNVKKFKIIVLLMVQSALKYLTAPHTKQRLDVNMIKVGRLVPM